MRRKLRVFSPGKHLRADVAVIGSAARHGPFSMNKKPVTCQDCYFRRHGLCALVLERPCPTFRAAGATLEPPRQPQLVVRPAAVAAA
jgi:hypothetical protein